MSIELQTKCVCDGCKKEQSAIGTPTKLNAHSLMGALCRMFPQLFYDCIPTGWRWVHTILLCKECFDSRFRDLFDASNI